MASTFSPGPAARLSRLAEDFLRIAAGPALILKLDFQVAGGEPVAECRRARAHPGPSLPSALRGRPRTTTPTSCVRQRLTS